MSHRSSRTPSSSVKVRQEGVQLLDVPKFNCYVPGNRLDDDQARELCNYTLANRQSFSDLTAMDVCVSTKGLHVAGVPIGDDAWVTKFVTEKVEAVILDVGKIDHVLDSAHIDSPQMRSCPFACRL